MDSFFDRCCGWRNIRYRVQIGLLRRDAGGEVRFSERFTNTAWLYSRLRAVTLVTRQLSLQSQSGYGGPVLGIRRVVRLSGDFENFGELQTRAVDPALDGTECHATDSSRFFVRESRRRNQQNGLPLLVRKLVERGLHIGHIEMTVLFRGDGEPARMDAVAVLDLALLAPYLRVELVPEDRV